MQPDPPNDSPADPRSVSDLELSGMLRSGQSIALGILYDRYAGLVYGLALTILTNAQEAEDLTQEIFLALCRNNNYNPGRGSFGSFLITVTRSRAIDKLRSRGRRLKFVERWGQTIMPEAPSSTPLEWASLSECSQYVQEALAQLPDNQRRVLEMSYYKGLSQTEIARELNTPLGTVKSWARKGLFKLKETLQDFVG